MKNKMKHIIALLLVLVMSFQMAAFVAADETATTEEVVEEAYVPQNLREFRILNALGIFTIYEEEDFTGNGELTRAETAAVAARMVGIVDGYSMEGKEMPYTDVSSTDTYAYEIYHMTNLGIMSGYNGEFNPGGAVTEEQFVKVVVEALGYGAEAQTLGGYPHGYTITAGKYHVLDDVNYKGAVPITQDVAVRIVYNCLEVEMPKVVSVENGGFLTTVGKTILSQYLDVTRSYGILKRNSNTFMGIGNESKEGVVQIGKDFYFTGTSNCDEYLGYNVEFFYKKTDSDSMGTILYAAPWKNDVVRLEADEIANYANREYKYYIGNRDKYIKFPAGADVIYNGVSAKGGFNKFVPEIGYVELIDNNEDGIYEVVAITSYEVYHISSNNTTECTITSKDSNNKLIKEYDKADWYVTNSAEEEIPAASVAKDMVLLLAVSENQRVVRGFQIEEQIEGAVESLYTQGTQKHVIINNTDYRVHSNCKGVIETEVKLGDYVGFYVYNDMLLIKCLPASSLTDSVGYLIEMDKTPGLGGKAVVRMLMQTGGVQIINVNDKAKLVIGDKTYNKPTEFQSLLTYTLENYAGEEANNAAAGKHEVTVRQPIIYKLNEAGELTYIEASSTHNYNEKVDIISGSDGFNLVEMTRGKWVRVNPKTRSIGDTQILLDKKSYVIDLPTDIDNYEGYKITLFSELGAWDTGANGNFTRPYRLYRTGDDILGANIMVGTQIRSTAASGATFFVEKIGEGITDDGEKCYVISGKTTSLANTTVKTANKAVVDSLTSPSVSIGDLITCGKNSYGLIDEINIRYDMETAAIISNSGEYFGSGSYNVGGQVYEIKNDSMAYYGGVIPNGGVASTDLRFIDIAKFKFVIFDPTLTRADSFFVTASVGEVKTYMKDPENVSTFLATMSGTEQGMFVIYR